jgi:hypothetical protein
LERHLGATRTAWSELERARAHLEACGHLDLSARIHFHLALSFLAEADLEAAASHLDDCLAPWWEAGLVDRLPDAVRAVAALAARRGESGKAARLWRGADEIMPAPATRLLDSEWRDLEAAVAGALEEDDEDAGEADRRGSEASPASRAAAAETVALAREVLAGRRRHVLRLRDTSAA